MIAIAVSLAVGLAGIAGTRLAVDRLAPRRRDVDVHAWWALGVAGTAPGWLVVWIALLPSTPGVRPQAAAGVAWILSSALALLGAIASEGRLRASAEAPPTPRHAWAWGALAVAPAWSVAALGRVAAAFTG
jgi:hypothetical protein